MKIKIVLMIILLSVLIIAGIIVGKLRSEGAELIREADRFNVPVVKQVMSELSKWDYVSLTPYLNKKFTILFTKEEFQKELDNLSVLGDVKKIKHIRHAGHKRYKNWLFSICAVNKYSVSTVFEKGNGTVVIDLNHCYKRVKVTFFQVHSKLLPNNSQS